MAVKRPRALKLKVPATDGSAGWRRGALQACVLSRTWSGQGGWAVG